MQLNSTNGGSVHDMVSLARQTECFPNPAGFISGAHLVKGQQKVSAQGWVKKRKKWNRGFCSRGCVFSAQLETFLFTQVISVGQTSAALQRSNKVFPKQVKCEAAANRLVKEEGLNYQVVTVKRNGCLF